MKSLAVANQKGGVGKTTIATHLAWHVAEQGRSVLFIDLDPQGNASSTFAQYAVAGVTTSKLFSAEAIPAPTASPGEIRLIASDNQLVDLDSQHTSVLTQFVRSVHAMAEPFDYCIVDVGPSLGNRMTAALLACDALLCPITPETYAIDGVAKMIATHAHIASIKRKSGLPSVFLGILLTQVNRTYLRHRTTAQQLIEAYTAQVLPAWLPTRSAIGEAQSARIPVWSLGTSSARDAGREMRELCVILTEKLDNA